MNKKLFKGLFILSIFGFLASCSSMNMNSKNTDGVTMNIVPSQYGAWVTVYQKGEPVEGATVNGAVTNKSGRVFVYTLNRNASSVLFKAQTPDGGMAERYAFIPRQRRSVALGGLI